MDRFGATRAVRGGIWSPRSGGGPVGLSDGGTAGYWFLGETDAPSLP